MAEVDDRRWKRGLELALAATVAGVSVGILIARHRKAQLPDLWRTSSGHVVEGNSLSRSAPSVPGIAAPRGGRPMKPSLWTSRSNMTGVQQDLSLAEMEKEDVPARLLPEFYFDFKAHPFEHQELLTDAHDIVDVLNRLHDYANSWLEKRWHERSDQTIVATEVLYKTGTRVIGSPIPEVCLEGTSATPTNSPRNYRPSVSQQTISGPGTNRQGGQYQAMNNRTPGRPASPVRLGETVFMADKLIGRLPSEAKEVKKSFSDKNMKGSGSVPHIGASGLQVGKAVKILGGTFDLREGGIYLGEGTVVEPGVYIAGPAIIGAGSTLRTGAYLRGDVVVGNGVTLRGELKNCLIMDQADLGHPGYAGDSIVGYKAHFGAQAVTANLGLFGTRRTCQTELAINIPKKDMEGQHNGFDVRVELGRFKIGAVLGDHSQLGCNAVTDPATFLGRETHVYPLTRLSSGFYGPHEIVKNKPEQQHAISREPLQKESGPLESETQG